MRRAAIIACLAASAACTHRPAIVTAPAPPARPTWAVSGQSNAVALQPYLEPYAATIGYSITSVPISCYAADGACWAQLEPTLHQTMSAFIWWQGEADIGGPLGGWDGNPMWHAYKGQYQAKLADLAGRVRAAAGNPALLFVIVRIENDRLDAEQDAFIDADGHALAIETRDIGFGDHEHMLPAQYEAVARRIASRLRAPAARPATAR